MQAEQGTTHVYGEGEHGEAPPEAEMLRPCRKLETLLSPEAHGSRKSGRDAARADACGGR